MIPIRIDPDGKAVFTTDQMEDYGYPEWWGFYSYYVIDGQPIYVSDYKQEQEYYSRPIHRYSRVERFQTILKHLLGHGTVPDKVVECVQSYNVLVTSSTVWDDVRKILKENGYSKYYSRIPHILSMLGCRYIVFDNYEKILNDFKRMSSKFDSMAWDRNYFPNLRFVALRMLEMEGAIFSYDIIRMRTKRKIKVMEDIFNKLY